ncbi:MAG: sulfite exporter TauE/SafE family protein [Candidatus Thalassarchaeaceae archaeon]|nr:sulfite exporter TauE/SafE family protein [Candidatus Thalassarchaeaceae archaeon]
MKVELTTIIALLMILMVAFMFAPLGLGGGVLFVPIFLYLLEWEIHLAIISSLSLVWMVSLGSRTAHSKDGFAVFEVGKKGAVAAVFGEIFGTFLSALFIMKLGDLPIKIIASLLLVWVIYYTVKKQLSEKTHAHSNEVGETQ